MKKNIRKLFFLTTILAVLFMSAMPSYAVYADGGTEADSPADDPPVTEPADSPADDPPVTEPGDSPADDPPVTEPADSPVEETVDLTPDEPATEPPLTEDAATEETASIPEILEQVPDETALVVINEEGDPEPLASQAAAEIILEGDPIWCPEGQVPTPGANGCTASHTGFDDLISDLTGGTYSGDGVIWVESTYDAIEDNSAIVFDGTSGNLATLNAISVLGGWNGISGSTSVDPNSPSVLDQRLRFINWTGAVSVSNLVIEDVPSFTSLNIETDGDINVDNVVVTNDPITGSNGMGASLDNCLDSGGCSGSGDVTVTDSEFNNNGSNGLLIHSAGDVLVVDVTTDGNDQHGIRVDTHDEADADVTIKDTTATNNTGHGMRITEVGGDLTLKSVTASNNDNGGFSIVNTLGDIKGSNLTANENVNDGIRIATTRGDVSLSNITANDSTNADGVEIRNTDGNVNLNSVTTDNNGQDGIEVINVDGSLGIYCANASTNGRDGILVSVDHDFKIKCSQSTNNGGDGLEIDIVAPTAQLLSFTSTGNTGADINYDPSWTTVTERKVDCSVEKKSTGGEKGPWTKLFCLPGEIKVALYDTYGDKVEFENLCGYEAGVFDPDSWIYPDEIPGGGDDYITSLQKKMLEEIPNLEPITEYGIAGVLAQVLDELPFMLPDDFSYVSSFFTAVLEDGEYMDPLPEESGLTIRFRVPVWLDPGEELSILWWDGAEWVDLGGEYSEDGYYFQVTTEETGVFVLAIQEGDL